jgi:hypothetical protein
MEYDNKLNHTSVMDRERLHTTLHSSNWGGTLEQWAAVHLSAVGGLDIKAERQHKQ